MKLLIAVMRDAGALPKDTKVKDVRQCVYGRLNSDNYEYRPKVCTGPPSCMKKCVHA